MNQLVFVLFALIFVYFFSNLCYRLFKIKSDRFYRPFHFTGGFLSYLLLNSFINIPILNLFLVVIIGIVWEMYEWILWKYFPKKNIKPLKKDTTNDLFFDLAGGMSAFLIQIVLKFLSS